MGKLISSLLLCMSTLCALPVSNPADASLYSYGLCRGKAKLDPCSVYFCWQDALSVRVGFTGEYVFNRHMQVGPNQINQADINHFTTMTNSALMVLNFANWYEIFGVLGATAISQTTNGSAYSNSNGIVTIDYGTHFSWGMGARMTIFHFNNWYFGVVGQYFRVRSRIGTFERLSNGDKIVFGSGNYAPYTDWQVAAGLSYPISAFDIDWLPYAALSRSGGDINNANFTFTSDNTTFTIRNNQPEIWWGYVIGCSFIFCDACGFSVEGRFLDEKAVNIIGQIRY